MVVLTMGSFPWTRATFASYAASFLSFQLRIDGYEWSTPFSVWTEGVMCISLRKEPASDPMHLRVEVRSGARSSRYEVIFRPNSFSSPYRLEKKHWVFLFWSFLSFIGCASLCNLWDLENSKGGLKCVVKYPWLYQCI